MSCYCSEKRFPALYIVRSPGISKEASGHGSIANLEKFELCLLFKLFCKNAFLPSANACFPGFSKAASGHGPIAGLGH